WDVIERRDQSDLHGCVGDRIDRQDLAGVLLRLGRQEGQVLWVLLDGRDVELHAGYFLCRRADELVGDLPGRIAGDHYAEIRRVVGSDVLADLERGSRSLDTLGDEGVPVVELGLQDQAGRTEASCRWQLEIERPEEVALEIVRRIRV